MNNTIYPNFPDPIQHPNRHWRDTTVPQYVLTHGFTKEYRDWACKTIGDHEMWTNTVKNTTSCLHCGLVPA